MIDNNRRRTLGLLSAGLTAGWQLPAAAQSWPTRPLHVVVPYTAGGGTDLLTRMIAEQMSTKLKQPVVVDNKPGANGVIATEAAAKSAPDGYTLLVGVPSTIAINPHLYKLSYDALRDVQALAQIAVAHFVLVTSSGSGFASLADLLAAARANPGKYSYASYGNGSAPHLAGVMLKSLGGAELTHIPYKGATQALPDVISGQVTCMFDVVTNVLPHIRSGRLRALAAAGHHAPPQLPALSTVSSVIPKFAVEGWVGLFMPAGIPAAIARRLEEEAVAAARKPELRQRLVDAGFEVTGLGAEAFARIVRNDYVNYARAVQAAGLTIE
jgi:tripartite-type tricarboxylate transporter receptor subunit TctC